MAPAMPSLVRTTANRAVHLKITPRPSNLGESREIMRLISQFGEVESFKNLRYSAVPVPSTTIVIFRQEDAAQYCVQKSPIRFRMGRTAVTSERNGQRGGDGVESSAAQMANPFSTPPRALSQDLPGPNPSTAPLPNAPDLVSVPPDPSNSRIFQITASSARVSFRDQLNTSHYHGAFPIDGKSAAQQDLARRVPILGLSDVNWRAADKPWHIVNIEKERDGAYKGSGRRRSLQELYEEATATAPGNMGPASPHQ